MNRKQLAVNLTAHGYGAKTDRIEVILKKLDDKDLADLLYVCSRAAEKLDPDAFNDEAA